MYHFNIILTECCNANCSHCYMSDISKKIKKTLTNEQVQRIVYNLPGNTKSVTLTGGEVFLVNDLLVYTIRLLKERFSSIEIEIESNGIYIYKNNIKEILEELKIIGVDSIRFSLDPFHKDGGVDLDKVKKIKDYESDKTPIIRFLEQDKALALGKGANLDTEKQTIMNCMNSEKSELNPYLFIDINGNVFTCAWKCVPPLGNIITDDFSKIEKSMKETFNKLILLGKIEEAINYKKGTDIEKLKDISSKEGQCYLCIKKYWN